MRKIVAVVAGGLIAASVPIAGAVPASAESNVSVSDTSSPSLASTPAVQDRATAKKWLKVNSISKVVRKKRLVVTADVQFRAMTKGEVTAAKPLANKKWKLKGHVIVKASRGKTLVKGHQAVTLSNRGGRARVKITFTKAETKQLLGSKGAWAAKTTAVGYLSLTPKGAPAQSPWVDAASIRAALGAKAASATLTTSKDLPAPSKIKGKDRSLLDTVLDGGPAGTATTPAGDYTVAQTMSISSSGGGNQAEGYLYILDSNGFVSTKVAVAGFQPVIVTNSAGRFAYTLSTAGLVGVSLNAGSVGTVVMNLSQFRANLEMTHPIAADPSGQYLYVIPNSGGQIAVINTVTNQIVNWINTPATAYTSFSQVNVGPDGTLYAPIQNGGYQAVNYLYTVPNPTAANPTVNTTALPASLSSLTWFTPSPDYTSWYGASMISGGVVKIPASNWANPATLFAIAGNVAATPAVSPDGNLIEVPSASYQTDTVGSPTIGVNAVLEYNTTTGATTGRSFTDLGRTPGSVSVQPNGKVAVEFTMLFGLYSSYGTY